MGTKFQKILVFPNKAMNTTCNCEEKFDRIGQGQGQSLRVSSPHQGIMTIVLMIERHL